jgi:hypothetical protein
MNAAAAKPFRSTLLAAIPGLLVMLSNCGSSTSGPAVVAQSVEDAGGSTSSGGLDSGTELSDGSTPRPDAAPIPGPIPGPKLGLNDVAFLLPISVAQTWQGDMVPTPLIDRLARPPGHSSVMDPSRYPSLRVVALRFDLCDRLTTKPCAPGAAGSLRIVMQPFGDDGEALDVALHAFYPVPSADVPAFVGELRKLASIDPLPFDAPLTVSPRLQSPGTLPAMKYLAGLKELASRYAIPERLEKLTFFSFDVAVSSVQWFFSGLTRKADGSYDDIVIPTASAKLQTVAIAPGGGGRVNYEFKPASDKPTGTLLSLREESFIAASKPAQEEAVGALLRAENPTLENAETVQCATCHVSTFLVEQRSQLAGYDMTKNPFVFKAQVFNLSTKGGSAAAQGGLLRAFGWFGTEAVISQRVVNEAANVALEIEQRYPATP